jgi:hypothetical protein
MTHRQKVPMRKWLIKCTYRGSERCPTRNQISRKIPLQLFDRTAGLDNVRFLGKCILSTIFGHIRVQLRIVYDPSSESANAKMVDKMHLPRKRTLKIPLQLFDRTAGLDNVRFLGKCILSTIFALALSDDGFGANSIGAAPRCIACAWWLRSSADILGSSSG